MLHKIHKNVCHKLICIFFVWSVGIKEQELVHEDDTKLKQQIHTIYVNGHNYIPYQGIVLILGLPAVIQCMQQMSTQLIFAIFSR